jgi:anti-sigma regulatory factor (Ser/Thr protein kinase)
MISSHDRSYLERLVIKLLQWFMVDHADPLERQRGRILIGLSTATIAVLVAWSLLPRSSQAGLMLAVSLVLLCVSFSSILLARVGHVARGAWLYIAALLTRFLVPINPISEIVPSFAPVVLMVLLFAYATLGWKRALVLGLSVSFLQGLLAMIDSSGMWVIFPWPYTAFPLVAGIVLACMGDPTSSIVEADQKTLTAVVNKLNRIEGALQMAQARLEMLQESVMVDGTSRMESEHLNGIEQNFRSMFAQLRTTKNLIEVKHLPKAIDPHPSDPAEMMRGLLNGVDDAAIEKNLRLTYVLDPYVETNIYQDLFRIREAAAEILNNALQYTEHGGIFVTLGQHDVTACVITIRDTGIGMSQDRLEEIRYALQNGDQIPNRSRRTRGQGLALAFHTMQRLGGHLSIDSTVGVGTTVSLVFPKYYRPEKSPRRAA